MPVINRRIEQVLQDGPVVREILGVLEEGRNLPAAAIANVSPVMVRQFIGSSAAERATRPFTEAVVIKHARPSLFVRYNRFDLPDSAELRARLGPVRAILEARLPSVGRVELSHHPQHRWCGTGWMIDDDILVTNAHVARIFCNPNAAGFPFLVNHFGVQIAPRIDFREEFHDAGVKPPSQEVAIDKVIFVEPNEQEPDIAFVRLKNTSGLTLPEPLPLFDQDPSDQQDIAVIGYPGIDPLGVPDAQTARDVFQDTYEVKRLSPGKVRVSDQDAWYFTHDATTLGGSSGSAVLDLESGAVIGLHFSGLLMQANYAVKVSTLRETLGRQNLRSRQFVRQPVVAPQAPVERPKEVSAYRDRRGFDVEFLAPHVVPHPTATGELANDVLSIQPQRLELMANMLHYTHFSVQMSKSKRLCLWSAVNIDGGKLKKIKRPGWRTDPRISDDQQVADGVYGNFPLYSRGHMTRRQDPIWGDTMEEAALGNADSMHVTNAVPQVQAFNGGVWNELEDYALENARQDRMRISVITGPIFSENDPIEAETQVPLEFYKVIAFEHDETRALTATGYIMSQEDFIRRKEFVFGEFTLGSKTYQVPIRVIEVRTGLSFGALRNHDPLNDIQESVRLPLTSLTEIRFTR